jgi:L-gulono-1,4-lactone dehydrogenase
MNWKNWAGNQQCSPEKIFYPTSVDDIKHIFLTARLNHKTVGIYGSSHSWSELVCADYLISTSKLKNILHIDSARQTVRTQAGISAYELNRQLARAGLSLPNQAYTQAQTIAGAIATATHGTGHTGTFSDFVHSIELITADGTLRILTPQENPQEFNASCVNVGCLGFVYAVTLRCVPSFNVRHSRILTDWLTVKKDFKQLYETHDFFMFFVNPYTNKAITYTYDKTKEPRCKVRAFLLKFMQKGFLNKSLGSLWVKVLDYKPSWTPAAIDFLYRASQTQKIIGRSFDTLTGIPTSHDSPIYFEQEIGVSIDLLPQAVDDILEHIKAFQNKNLFIFPTGILIRFAQAARQGLISPTAGRESAYISVTTSHYHEEFFTELETSLVNKYHGRPHWGKINFLDYQTAHALYQEQLDEFIFLREKLDPDGMFLNPYKTKVFTKPPK